MAMAPQTRRRLITLKVRAAAILLKQAHKEASKLADERRGLRNDTHGALAASAKRRLEIALEEALIVSDTMGVPS